MKLSKRIVATAVGGLIVAGLIGCESTPVVPPNCTQENRLTYVTVLSDKETLAESVKQVDDLEDTTACRVRFHTTIAQIKQWRSGYNSDEASTIAMSLQDDASPWSFMAYSPDGSEVTFAGSIPSYEQLNDDDQILFVYDR